MPNPGSFTGSRGEFLKQQRERYAQAVKDGNINDAVADIQRQYFKRYPITLAHEEEPSQEWLAQVDDDAPDPEIEPPHVDGMDPEDASKALKQHADLMKKLKDRKDSIRRRLHYMYSKEQDPRPSAKSGMASDIVSALTAKIVGVDSKIPRQKTAYNMWGPQHREIVDPVFNRRVEEGNIPANQQIALRSAIYKELFNELPEDERELWAKAAIREHEKAVREIKKNLEKGASTTPQDRQRVITALPSILEPIFDLLAEHTGWRFSGIAGGPEPVDGGRLNMIMIHSGVIPGTVKVDFGRDQHEAFKKHITPSFGSYLKKCFTIDECRSRALPEGFDIRSLADVDAEDTLDLHSFDIDKEHVDASKSHKAKRLFEKGAKLQKSKKPEPPQDRTPAAPLRFGPPLKKIKKRDLPSKDKPKQSTNAQTSSVLTSGGITASAMNGASILQASLPDDSHFDSFHQEFDLDDLGDVPPKRVLPADDASALYGAVARALQCYISTASRVDPPTPAPSRDPVVSQVDETITHAQPHTVGNTVASPVTTPISLPPSPLASRPASPQAGVTSNHEVVPQAIVPPSQDAAPPSQLEVPRPRPLSPQKTPLLNPTTPQSHPTSPPRLSISPLSLVLHEDVTAVGTLPPALSTPSGATTVPALPSANTTPTKPRDSRASSGGAEKRKAPSQTRDVPKKKQRVVSVNKPGAPFDPSFPINLPSDCPPWLRTSLDLLTAEDLGASWRALIVSWLDFEEKSGFAAEGGRLSSRGRPQCIADWIKRARSPQYTPNVGNLAVYEATFVKWWNSVQPDWRNAGVDIEVGGERTGDDWSCLENCYGLNGMLSAIAALFFWGSAAAADGESTGWHIVVADVLYVLGQLA